MSADVLPPVGARVRVTYEGVVVRHKGSSIFEVGKHWHPFGEVTIEVLSPPKPPEPTGLGAVVEDTEGQRWVRPLTDSEPWVCDSDGQLDWRTWSRINVVRVLSEGVTE